MNGNIVARLVMKDLYLQRGLIIAALVAGVFSILISGISRLAFNIGSTFYLTTIIAYGVVLVMFSIAQERKDKAHLFVLSLPISGAQYLQAKILAVLTAFGVPWAVLTIGGVILILFTGIPDGFLPFYLLVSMYMFVDFCIVLAGAVLASNEALMTAVIIITNLSVTLFLMLISNIPAIQSHAEGASAVWTPPFFIVLAAEIAVALIALSLPFCFGRQRRGLI